MTRGPEQAEHWHLPWHQTCDQGVTTDGQTSLQGDQMAPAPQPLAHLGPACPATAEVAGYYPRTQKATNKYFFDELTTVLDQEGDPRHEGGRGRERDFNTKHLL